MMASSAFCVNLKGLRDGFRKIGFAAATAGADSVLAAAVESTRGE
jgi:hypothetical protein